MSELTAASNRKSLYSTKTLVTLSMLTALAYAVMCACKIIPPIGGFLSVDVKDTVIVIAGILYGPLSALLLSIVVPLLEFFTVSDTGLEGLIMNIIATAIFCCPAAYVYRRKHNTTHAVLGLVTGVACLTVTMIFWNIIVTPYFFKIPREAVLDMLIPLIIPFNLIKGALNSALIMIVYTPVVSTLRKIGLVPPSQSAGQAKSKFNYAPTIVSGLILVTAVLLVLAFLEII